MGIYSSDTEVHHLSIVDILIWLYLLKQNDMDYHIDYVLHIIYIAYRYL